VTRQARQFASRVSTSLLSSIRSSDNDGKVKGDAPALAYEHGGYKGAGTYCFRHRAQQVKVR
jgi:hypothetical protein